MPKVTMLILAAARADDGLLVAGMTTEPDPVTGLRWVRLLREHGRVRMEDLIIPAGQSIHPFDVVELDLLRPRPIAPRTEDWIADFEQERPRIVRHLEGERRSRFLRKHCDNAPRQVLVAQQRSLSLIKPDSMAGSFRQKPDSAHLEARLAFELGGHTYRGSFTKGGFAVADPVWLAWGRSWLPDGGEWVEFDEAILSAWLGIVEIYLVVSLSRRHKRRFEPIIVGVHTVPDHLGPLASETWS
jgi:hypothetical protein